MEKPVSKDTNPETFWNNFDKIISITKLKLENPKWGLVKMANMVHTEKPVTLTHSPNPNPNQYTIWFSLNIILFTHLYLWFYSYIV
jgi:hypothetical protein